MNKLSSINFSLYLGAFFVTILAFLAVFGPLLAPHSLTETLRTSYVDGKILAPPMKPFESKSYPLGTDRWGYDLLSMILYGLRYTFLISIVVTGIKMTIGTIIGMYAGTWKRTPQWIIAFETGWSYVPLFLILFFFLNPITINGVVQSFDLVVYFILIASAVSIPSIVSSVRKKAQEISKLAYIEAAHVLGGNRHRIVWKHIFPQLKESSVIMFVLEVINVIALMGQLALMNIFIGGTIYRPDSKIFLSVTKEISGLVGSARGSIYGGSTFILYIPLALLLIITFSFSLLANGLKNRFQHNYQRTPWVKTGFETKLKPLKKKLGK